MVDLLNKGKAAFCCAQCMLTRMFMAKCMALTLRFYFNPVLLRMPRQGASV